MDPKGHSGLEGAWLRHDLASGIFDPRKAVTILVFKVQNSHRTGRETENNSGRALSVPLIAFIWARSAAPAQPCSPPTSSAASATASRSIPAT